MSTNIEQTGLTQAQVDERIANGQSNVDTSVKTRSIKRIFYENIFTLFNAVNVILAIIVFCTGAYKNMLFMGVIICNTAIGIIQEIRSKKTTDKLTIVAEAKVKVLRDSKIQEIPIDQIVLDDVIELGRGDQVPTDCVVLSGKCDANESLLTGESDLIHKSKDSKLMSGSFINSGKVRCKVINVGADNYAAKITAEAKAHKAVNSQIMDTMNGLIKFVSMIIFPLGIIMFCKSYFLLEVEMTKAILTTTAAMIGMIPEGLILLTSTVLAVSVIRLSKYEVLVQQLYCIETLARVDTLCLDKTGTITSGKMDVDKIVNADATPENPDGTPANDEVNMAFASLVEADDDRNETSLAIENYFTKGAGAGEVDRNDLLKAQRVVPFSSDKKWSGAMFEDCGYVMGATQFVLKNAEDAASKDPAKRDALDAVIAQAEKLSADARVLLLARVEGFTEDGDIIGEPVPLGFVCVMDQIRETAASTIQYFASEGVDLKVISGDDPRTVSGIAQKVGVRNAENYVDATTLKTDEDIEEAINKYSVFGRVKPEQKKAFVVALQKHGHTVAMTGDGVNDVLSLKQADCSVAMAAGSSAARNVAHLVLINNDFASMTQVVAEGRRSINNLQRSASLFLVKTLVSMALAIITLIAPWPYPFQPIQMTLVSMFTIGLPSFVLALEPNHDRIKGHFLENVIVRSIPSALVTVLSVIAINIIGYNCFGMQYNQISTMCVLTMSVVGILLIIKLSIPFTGIRIALIIVVIAGTLIGCALFDGKLFGIEPFTQEMITMFVGIIIVAGILFFIIYDLIDKWYTKRQAKLV